MVGDQQDAALQHRVVAPCNALDQPVPTPGQAKIVSVSTAPPNRLPTCRPITVITGISALRSACSPTTRQRRQPLGARRAHVVLVQHLQHRRARHARDHRQRDGAERDRRQDQMRQRRAKCARSSENRLSISMKPVTGLDIIGDVDPAR